MSEPITIERQIAAVRHEIEEMRDTLEVPLHTGQTLIIEKRDLWVFTYWRWSVRQHHSGNTYLHRKERGRAVHFHREIIAAPDEFVVDHINGNGLDNRRSNLRLATRTQNNWNRAFQRDKGTGFMGVSFHRASGLWRARLKVGDTAERTSYHQTPEEAAKARDAMALQARGEFAALNFHQADRQIATMEAAMATLESVRAERQAKVTPGLF